jgi:TRAP transporter TAXI family solute receptor
MIKFIITFLLFVQFVYGQNTLILASANKNDTYDNLAKSIKKIVEAHSEYKVEIVNTRGSVDNIKRLDKGTVDLAIVQNDTAFYAENGFSVFEKKPILDLQMLFTFYDEPIYIVTNKPNINSLEQLLNMRINVGEKNSGLLESAKVLLKSTKIWKHITPFYLDPVKSLAYLEKSKVQAIFLNTLNDEVKKKIALNLWYVVPVPIRLISKLQNTFSYFLTYKVEDNTYTVAVKSILISKNSLDKEVTYLLSKLLYEHRKELVFPKDCHNDKSKEGCFCFNPLKAWHMGTEQFFNEHHITPKTFDTNTHVLYGLGATVLILLLILFLVIYIFHKITVHKNINPNDNYIFNLFKMIYLKIVDHKYVIFFIVVLSLYFVSIFFIKYFEHQWALANNMYSAFDNFSLWESLLWLFIFATSSYSGGIFPHSEWGQFFASLVPMIGWGGLLAFATLIASDKIKRFLLEVKGMGSIKDEDHIILCGWNKNGCNIIQALTHDNIAYKHKIIILAEEKYKSEIDLCVLGQKDVIHLVGYAKSKEDLERSNLLKSHAVVVLQDDTHTDPDAYAILDVLTINKYANDLKIREQKGAEFQIIIQLHSNKNKQIAIDAGADQIISLSSIESNILSNMIQTPGVNHLVEEIFDFNDTNDIYSIDVTANSKLVDTTYNEALVLLREFNILLLSINIAYHRRDEEAQKIKKEHGLTRNVITNPINEAENNYKIQEGEMLIVLAQYGDIVTSTVEKLEEKEE